LASIGSHRALSIARSQERVAVRYAGKLSGRGRVRAAAEINIAHYGVAGGVAVGVIDGLVTTTLKDGAFHQELGPLARVNRCADT
jgi:hypothetical protein